MSFLTKIENFFRGAEVVVSKDFEALVGKDNAVQFGHEALAVLKTALGKIVAQAVQEVESIMSGAPGSDKHSAALQRVEAAAKAAGIVAGKSIVNMLIELAVAALQAKFAPVA